MPLSVNSFTPSTKILSSEVNTNFTTLVNALNNMRPMITWWQPYDISVDTNINAEFVIKENQSLTIVGVDLRIKTAPVGSALIVDINKNGSTIFSTRPEIADGANTGGGSAVLSTTTATAGDKFTVDIDQVGSSTAGENLTVILYFKL